MAISKYLRQARNGGLGYTTSYVFPYAIFRSWDNNGDNEQVRPSTMAHLHQLMIAHLVSATNTRTTAENTNGDTFLAPAVRYSLTPTGSRLFFSGNSSTNGQICYADITVKKVINFTIPGQANGETTSRIQWEADAVPDKAIAPMLHSGNLQFLTEYATENIANPRLGSAVLTHLGWEYGPNS
ncbi:MAG: hypothetical protein HKL92_00470 [Candidatus Eremiobacteraeota bacterium]|nr:hypothetical protein [Candidatus Eremiobacteraeota bacterium]